MGGKSGGSSATNEQMVNMQMQQAQQAQEANVERNARLQYGTQQINNIFQGRPKGSVALDLSKLADPNAQAGLNWSQAAANPTGMITYNGQIFNGQTWVPDPNAAQEPGSLPGGYQARQMPDSGGATQYGLYDPQGNLVTTAGSLADLSKAQVYTGGDPTQTEGGFGKDFYDKFTQSQLDYYLPQEGQQYNKAQTNLDYSLARAGTLNSSIAATDIADLAQQDKINKAQIAANADTQTGQLRTTIQQDQQSALNQLYSTEDPTVSINTAQNMVANANLTKPMLNPLGALFTPIVAGVGNAMTGFTNPYAYINPGAGMMGSASTPGVNQGSGVNVNASV